MMYVYTDTYIIYNYIQLYVYSTFSLSIYIYIYILRAGRHSQPQTNRLHRSAATPNLPTTIIPTKIR